MHRAGENPGVRARVHACVCGKCTLSAVHEADSPALLKVSLFRWLGQHVVPYWSSARSVHPDNTRRFTNLPHSSATGWSKLCAPRSAECRPTIVRERLARPDALDFPMYFEGRIEHAACNFYTWFVFDSTPYFRKLKRAETLCTKNAHVLTREKYS